MSTPGQGTMKGQLAASAIAQYRFVEDGSTANEVQQADASSNPIRGVCQNDPAAGEEATVVNQGETFIECAAALAKDARVTADANGKAVATASGKHTPGRLLEAATGDGHIVRMLIDQIGDVVDV